MTPKVLSTEWEHGTACVSRDTGNILPVPVSTLWSVRRLKTL